jgi:hypothetical protein
MTSPSSVSRSPALSAMQERKAMVRNGNNKKIASSKTESLKVAYHCLNHL